MLLKALLSLLQQVFNEQLSHNCTSDLNAQSSCKTLTNRLSEDLYSVENFALLEVYFHWKGALEALVGWKDRCLEKNNILPKGLKFRVRQRLVFGLLLGNILQNNMQRSLL